MKCCIWALQVILKMEQKHEMIHLSVLSNFPSLGCGLLNYLKCFTIEFFLLLIRNENISTTSRFTDNRFKKSAFTFLKGNPLSDIKKTTAQSLCRFLIQPILYEI